MSGLNELYTHGYLGSTGNVVAVAQQSTAVYWVVEAAKKGRQSEAYVRDNPESDWEVDNDAMRISRDKIAALKPSDIKPAKSGKTASSKEVTLQGSLAELSRTAGFLARNGLSDRGIELLTKSIDTVVEQLTAAAK